MIDTPKKIRIGEAASAIGATPKALRNWISRYSGRGLKPTTEQTGTWLEFSFGDVAALALTRYFVDLGMPAYGAFSVAMKLVEVRWPQLFDTDAPAWSPAPSSGVFMMYRTPEGDWGFVGLDREVKRFTPPDDCRVLVYVMATPIISDALDALEEMGHERPILTDVASEATSQPEKEQP